VRFSLKDYQVDAVADILKNLRRAHRDFHEHDEPSAFSLTATTGAGKTVMAAAVIEALFGLYAAKRGSRPRIGVVM
jgi:type III restriction enzyme